VCAFIGATSLGVTSADQPAKSESSSAKPGVAAYVGDQTITTQELDEKALKTNMKLAQSLYDARKAVLDQVIVETVLASEAKEKGVSVDELVKQRLAEKVTPPTDEEIKAYYDTNSARMGGRTLEQVSGQIKNFLANQRETQAREALMTQLKEKAQVKVVLEPPRVEVPIAANDPMKGPKEAKITIVEFSEFQ
jgi:hypothetical protein